MKKKSKKQYKDFLEFLETAVASENLKKDDPETWKQRKRQLEKERLLVRLKIK